MTMGRWGDETLIAFENQSYILTAALSKNDVEIVQCCSLSTLQKNCTSNDYLTFYSARAAAHSSAPRSSKFLGLNLKLQTSTCRLQAKLRMQPTCYYLCPNSSYIHQLSLELLSLLLLLLTFSNHPPMTNHFLYRKCTPRLLNEVFIISEALLEEVF